MITFNSLTPTNPVILDALTRAYVRVMESGRYIGGDEVEAFEREFADYVDANYCIAVGNGFDALQIAMKAAEIGPGSHVGVPTNTCIPTWAAVYNVGAQPVPIEPGDNFLISPDNIPDDLDAVIPVHLYGNPISYLDIIYEMPGVIIEDACQAHGAYYKGEHVGTAGNMGCFSFYPTKNLGAFGDGGAIVTNNWGLAERCRQLRRYGEPGAINSCLDPLQAAFLRVKLKYLEAENDIRRGRASLYRYYLADCKSIELPIAERGKTYNYHQFVIKATRRDDLQEYLLSRGIETMVHYRELPASVFPTVTSYKPSKAVELSNCILSLPIANVSSLEVEQVCDAIKEYYGLA